MSDGKVPRYFKLICREGARVCDGSKPAPWPERPPGCTNVATTPFWGLPLSDVVISEEEAILLVDGLNSGVLTEGEVVEALNS